MKKIAHFHQPDKPSCKHLILAVDVSSHLLDLYSRYRQDAREYELSESFLNDLPTIHQKLDEYDNQARVLARNDRILGPYYHRKLSEGIPPRKAKVAFMRKLVKLLYGAAKSSQPTV